MIIEGLAYKIGDFGIIEADMDSKGRQLHSQANEAREKEQNFLKSLQLTDEALLAYQEEGDSAGFSEVLAERSITFRHLFERYNDKKFLYLARAEMIESVRIARESGKKEALALPLFNLAKVEEALEEYTEAVTNYREAIENISIDPAKGLDPNSPAQNRPSYLANMEVHLHFAEYKNGDKSAKERMIKALKDLEDSEEPDKYSKEVWISGGYMSLAYMLKDDSPEEAKEYLQKAKEIIDSNPDLTLRENQWEKLSKEFK